MSSLIPLDRLGDWALERHEGEGWNRKKIEKALTASGLDVGDPAVREALDKALCDAADPAAVCADSEIPTSDVIGAAAAAYAGKYSPVVVNGALRNTTGGLSDPAAGPRSSVFQGAFQTINLYRNTPKGIRYFTRPDIAAGVYEAVKAGALPVRIGRAAYVREEFIAAPGLHREHAYYCNEQTPVIDYQGPAKAAVVELYDSLFRLFPFVDADHIVRLFAMVLSPFLMLHVNGPVPAILITAPNRGDGKTLLACCVAMLADDAAVVVTYGNGPKFHEDLLSALDSAARVVIIDNVKGPVEGPLLEGLITTRKIRGNLKFENSRDFINDKLIIITGVNVIVSPDIARRVVRIVVDRRGAPQPVDMPDLGALIPRERGRYLGMIRAILGGWNGALLPMPGHKTFEEWAATIAGVLSSCGVLTGPMKLIDPEGIAAEHDSDAILWGELLETWYGKCGESAVSAAEVVGMVGTSAVRNALSVRSDEARKLGAALSAMNGRILCGFRISKEKQRVFTSEGEHNRNVYRLEKVGRDDS